MDTRDGTIYESLKDAFKAGVISEYLLPMQIQSNRTQRRAMKVGRNSPCPCGSGLKFKKCHLGMEGYDAKKED